MVMKSSKVLAKAAKLLTQETWCTGCAAARADGYGVDPNDRWAAHWCLLGACCKILDLERPYQLPKDLLSYIIEGICDVEPNIMGWDLGTNPSPSDYTRVIGVWNDNQASYKDIRGALLAAVQHAERDESHDR